MSHLKNNNPPVNRLHVVPATYIILRRDNQILFLRRFNTGYKDGSYSLPAGHMDGGESAIQVAVREAKEEVGIEIDITDLKFVHVLHRVAEESSYERIDFFFETDTWKGDIQNMEPHKSDDLKWFDINNLPGDMTPEVKQALGYIAHGGHYSDLDF